MSTGQCYWQCNRNVIDNMSIEFEKSVDILNLLSGSSLGVERTKMRFKIEWGVM